MMMIHRLVHRASMGRRSFSHVPVMADEILEILQPSDGKIFIDMTFGGGGHTRRLLETNKSIKIIAVDRDPTAFRKAQELSSEVALKSERLNINQSVIPIHGKFSSVMRDIHLSGVPFGSVNGVIFDLGASSMQYDNSDRGFALSSNGPLDMRMDNTDSMSIKAEDIVNNLDFVSLSNIIKILGEEKRSRKITNAIIDARTLLGRIRTTQELARIIGTVAGESFSSQGRFSHPATKTFQALRIFVNNELNEINYAIDRIREYLIPFGDQHDANSVNERELINRAGVAAVLTFHSLEDRIVKRHFTGIDPNEPVVKHMSQHARIKTNVVNVQDIDKADKNKKWRPIFKHVLKPSSEEIAANPRSRSAKLRAAVRIS